MSLDMETLHAFEYTINPHLLLEMFLNDIRNETILYSTAKHKRENEHEKLLFNNYAKLQNISAQPDPPPQTLILNWKWLKPYIIILLKIGHTTLITATR